MRSRPRPSDVTKLRMQVVGLARRLRREADANDESWSRLLLLGAIDRHGTEATPSVLAEAESMRSSNLAAALRDLDRRGLISRTPDVRDRRKVRVALTPLGRSTLHENRSRRERWLAQAMLDCLSGDERARLIEAGELIERLLAYTNAAATDNDQ